MSQFPASPLYMHYAFDRRAILSSSEGCVAKSDTRREELIFDIANESFCVGISIIFPSDLSALIIEPDEVSFAEPASARYSR